MGNKVESLGFRAWFLKYRTTSKVQALQLSVQLCTQLPSQPEGLPMWNITQEVAQMNTYKGKRFCLGFEFRFLSEHGQA